MMTLAIATTNITNILHMLFLLILATCLGVIRAVRHCAIILFLPSFNLLLPLILMFLKLYTMKLNPLCLFPGARAFLF